MAGGFPGFAVAGAVAGIALIAGAQVVGTQLAAAQQYEACRQFVGSVCASVAGRQRTFANACTAQRMGGVIVHRGPCLRRTRPFATGPGSRAPDPRAKRGAGAGRGRGVGPFRGDARRRGVQTDCSINRPVCARWKGRLRQFDTPCAAREAGAKKFRLGLCRQASTPARRERAARYLCAKANNPVCAMKNGVRKTYRNACHATVDLAVVVSKGACSKP